MRIPSKLPGSLSIRGAGGGLYSNVGANYNYAIGGLPFMSAASDTSYGHWWIKRETAPFRKDQFDNAQNPGEQSLQGYWLRSVMSWHGGAGQIYADPVSGTTSSDIRFFASRGADVWTPGSLSLLRDTTALSNNYAVTELVSVAYGTTPGVFGVTTNKYIQSQISGTTVTTNSFNWSGGTMFSVTTDGQSLYIHAADGLYKGTIPALVGSTITWTKIYTYTATSGEVGYVKDRIVLGADQALYELSPSPASPPAALPTALYTAKVSGWTWSAVTETTGAIYAVGYSGSASSVLKFVLSTTGALPTLTGGTVACQLPGGETARTAFGYLGIYLGLGTSRGVRIAIADSDGNLTYGPLLWDNHTTTYDFAARDHWLWCTYKDSSDTAIKLARIDLGQQLDTLTFAYATDLIAEGDGMDCTTVAFYGNSELKAFSTTGGKAYNEHPANLVSSGWLQTSRIRFNTLEPKIFRSVRVRGPVLEGPLSISYATSSGSLTPVFTYGIDQTPGTDDINLSGQVFDWIALRFDLSRNTLDPTVGAVVNGWQVKALPGSPRQRMITLPLFCFDFEKDKLGQRVGGHGFAFERLTALENLEAAGNVITYQDLDNGTAQDVYIESLEFQQSAPPPHVKVPGSFGGRILIQMRTV